MRSSAAHKSLLTYKDRQKRGRVVFRGAPFGISERNAEADVDDAMTERVAWDAVRRSEEGHSKGF